MRQFARFQLTGILVILISIMGCGEADAQSRYLRKGVSGILLGGGLSSTEDVTGFHGGIGYSFSGTTDIGLTVGRASQDNTDLGDLSATSFSPFVNSFLVKQDESTPVSVVAGLGYQRVVFSSDALDAAAIDLTTTGYWIDLSLLGKVSTQGTLDIFPEVGVEYFDFTIEAEDSFGSSASEDDSTTSLFVRAALAFRQGTTSTFLLRPGVSVDEDNTTFSISVGWVFPTSQPGG